MDLFDALHSLRATRRLKPDPIPDEVLQQILEATAWRQFLSCSRIGTSAGSWQGGNGTQSTFTPLQQRGECTTPDLVQPRVSLPLLRRSPSALLRLLNALGEGD